MKAILPENSLLRIMHLFLKLRRTPLFASLLLVFLPFIGMAQMPTHVDPGSETDPVNLQENPEYIVLIVLLIAAMLLFYFRAKRSKSSEKKDDGSEK
ncbi:MAG: hypothetical protein ABR574_05930 [Cryomorphaceae bacterium]